MSVRVELLASPFCMADRDNETVGRICLETGAQYRLLNMWDMEDGKRPHGNPRLIRESVILIYEHKTKRLKPFKSALKRAIEFFENLFPRLKPGAFQQPAC